MTLQRLLIIAAASFVLMGMQPVLAAKRYQVEIIIFEHLSMNTGGEVWPEEGSIPQWDDALAIFSDAQDSRFSPLPGARYKMGGIYRVLRSSQDYRPIMHIAWEQVGLPSSRAQSVYVASDNSQVQGAVTLEQSRFLFVDMELIYQMDDSDGRFAHIDERRRMKLKELHYFDNPVFGAIVQVTRAPTEQASDETGEGS